MNKLKALLLGCGNMANVIFDDNLVNFFQLSVYTPSVLSAQKFARRFNCDVVDNMSDIKSQHFDILFLFFKPQQFEEVVQTLSDQSITSDAVISVLASVSTNRIKKALFTANILRLMPNTPSKIGKGVITIYKSGELQVFKDFENSLGRIATVIEFNDESMVDLTTPITGSGPAFIFELARIWQQFLESKGVESSLSKELVANTFLGSAELLTQTTDCFCQLRDEVTSKKGVTEAGLKSLYSSDFEKIVIKSLQSALKRLDELK
jgi:pyrroline-5-carboxylate reductase